MELINNNIVFVYQTKLFLPRDMINMLDLTRRSWSLRSTLSITNKFPQMVNIEKRLRKMITIRVI